MAGIAAQHIVLCQALHSMCTSQHPLPQCCALHAPPTFISPPPNTHIHTLTSQQLKWQLGSSVPGLGLLLRKYAPHDTYTIWNVRIGVTREWVGRGWRVAGRSYNTMGLLLLQGGAGGWPIHRVQHSCCFLACLPTSCSFAMLLLRATTTTGWQQAAR